MNRKYLLFCLTLLFAISLSLSPIFADTHSWIKGYVKDKGTGDALPYANILVVGTSLGTTTDLNGNYSLKIPPGTYLIRCQYIGYKTVEKEITVAAGQTAELNFSLIYGEVIKGKEVTITAQAEGQIKALNQQLASQQIVSVVSSARIEELPDANAAESIARLPGVSIKRYGGEGNQVVIRGLSPKYNAIAIDGVRIASSNPQDRSADLSMISSNMLAGIEVYKTITADMDADVLGGTVNFKMREPTAEKKGIGFNLTVQGGYSGLSNAYNRYDNYKIIPSIEGRAFNKKLGIFLQLNLEKRNLTSNEFGASYNHKSADHIHYITNSIDIHYIPRFRQRKNAALLLDYQLPFGKINFSSFASSSITKVNDRYENLNIDGNSHNYYLSYSKSTLNLFNNAIGFDGSLWRFHTNFKIAHSYSENDRPNDWWVSFYQTPAGINQFSHKANLDPKKVAEAVLSQAGKTKLNQVYTNDNLTLERALSLSLDMDTPFNLSKSVSAIVKFGGKYRFQNRAYNAEVNNTNATFVSPSAQGAARMIISEFHVPTNDPTAIPLSFFKDENFDYGKVLNGDYELHHPMNFGMIEHLVEFCKDNIDEFAKQGSREAFAHNTFLSVTNDYSGEEEMIAGYLMATVKIGSKWTIIPGIRYQSLKTTYSGTRGQQTPLSYLRYDHSTDTTVTVKHPFWLPNLNIRYKPSSWFDIRAAYSQTISYPDYITIIPRIDASTGADVAWNNYELKPSRSRNYDLYFTFFNNTAGLFSIGGFWKKIEDLIYPWRFSVPGTEAKKYYLTNKTPSPQITYNISTYVNNPFVTNNYGIELDWQTHFWYLPNPFKGLVLNFNYTRVRSEAKYPFVKVGAVPSANVDTSFVDRLIDQPDHILNLSFGYDYKGFSFRISMLYQDDVFTGASQWPQLRSTTASYKRWDFSFKQKLPWLGMELYGDINNINNARDVSALQMYPNIPTSIEMYGMTADLGLRIRL